MPGACFRQEVVTETLTEWCLQVTSRLQEANQADVNVSQSTAVEDMKQRLSARILAFELLVSNL